MVERHVSVALSLVAALMLAACDPDEDKPPRPPGSVDNVTVPKVFSQQAAQGARLYQTRCESCHGANAAGTNKGPSLIRYERSHHSDGAFFQAVREGVKEHHWNFGDMPPVAGINSDEVSKIVGYVRELQRANGIN